MPDHDYERETDHIKCPCAKVALLLLLLQSRHGVIFREKLHVTSCIGLQRYGDVLRYESFTTEQSHASRHMDGVGGKQIDSGNPMRRSSVTGSGSPHAPLFSTSRVRPHHSSQGWT